MKNLHEAHKRYENSRGLQGSTKFRTANFSEEVTSVLLRHPKKVSQLIKQKLFQFKQVI